MARPKKKIDPQDLPPLARLDTDYPPLEPEEREKWLQPWFTEPPMTKDEALRLLRDSDAMREYVFSRSRLPFQEVLARMLRAEPSPERMRQFAVENPDKWARMVRDSASLAGYKEGIEIDASVTTRIADMSDAEIMQHLAKYATDVGLAIPGRCETVDESGETPDESGETPDDLGETPDGTDETTDEPKDSPENAEFSDYIHPLDVTRHVSVIAEPVILPPSDFGEDSPEDAENTLLEALLEENPDLETEEVDDFWLT